MWILSKFDSLNAYMTGSSKNAAASEDPHLAAICKHRSEVPQALAVAGQACSSSREKKTQMSLLMVRRRSSRCLYKDLVFPNETVLQSSMQHKPNQNPFLRTALQCQCHSSVTKENQLPFPAVLRFLNKLPMDSLRFIPGALACKVSWQGLGMDCSVVDQVFQWGST